MKNIIQFIIWIFSNKYTPYTLYKTKVVKVAETKIVPDPNVEIHVDPMDYITVKTGNYYNVTRQIWVKYHKKTGIPKYKTIELD